MNELNQQYSTDDSSALEEKKVLKEKKVKSSHKIAKGSFIYKLALVALLSLYGISNPKSVQAQQINRGVGKKEVTDNPSSHIKILPSWVYFQFDLRLPGSTPLVWIDKKSCKLVYLWANSSFIEDENGVYKVLSTEDKNRPKNPDIKDEEKWPHNYKATGGNWYVIISLLWTDKTSFHVVNEDFAFDKNTLYYIDIWQDVDENTGEPILSKNSVEKPIAFDAPTLKKVELDKEDYNLIDKNGVYYQGIAKFEWADPGTFALLWWSSFFYYFTDKDSVYLAYDFRDTKRLCKNTWKNVKIIWDQILTDGISVFIGHGKKVEQANPKTFKQKWDLYMDDKHVWYMDWSVMEWANPKTLEEVKEKQYWITAFYRDDKYVWLWNTKIEWANPETFKELDIEDPLYKYEDIHFYYDEKGKKYPKE